MKIFDLYSALLRYPLSRDGISHAIDSLGISDTAHFRSYELGVLQEEYVEAFDFSEKASLLMTGHIAPDEKDRGNVLAGFAAFRKLYGGAGKGNASPDYLPDMLNAFQNAVDSEEGLVDAGFMACVLMQAVEKINNAINRSGSVYSPIFAGLIKELRHISENTEVCNA